MGSIEKKSVNSKYPTNIHIFVIHVICVNCKLTKKSNRKSNGSSKSIYFVSFFSHGVVLKIGPICDDPYLLKKKGDLFILNKYSLIIITLK